MYKSVKIRLMLSEQIDSVGSSEQIDSAGSIDFSDVQIVHKFSG